MSDGIRRRSDSRSPLPPRTRKSGKDSFVDGRGGGRSVRHEHERGRDNDRDHDPDSSYGGRAGNPTVKEELVYDTAGPRHGSDRERERERDRDRNRRPEHNRDRERERGVLMRDFPDPGYGGGGERGGPHSRRNVDLNAIGGGRGDGSRRERGADGDWGQPGGGGDGGRGSRDAESSRYLSVEEREDLQMQAEEAAKPKAPKEKANLGLSGKLAAETNKVAGGIELKHVPPPESRKPDKRWRLYIFKNDKLQDEPYRIHRNTHYLFGRDVHVADIITAHPSCSKQHAVLQFRLTDKDDEFGRSVSAVRPYLLDLGSVNGTFLNGDRLEHLRYYELMEKDVVRLGQSTREYVLLHDQSKDE